MVFIRPPMVYHTTNLPPGGFLYRYEIKGLGYLQWNKPFSKKYPYLISRTLHLWDLDYPDFGSLFIGKYSLCVSSKLSVFSSGTLFPPFLTSLHRCLVLRSCRLSLIFSVPYPRRDLGDIPGGRTVMELKSRDRRS